MNAIDKQEGGVEAEGGVVRRVEMHLTGFRIRWGTLCDCFPTVPPPRCSSPGGTLSVTVFQQPLNGALKMLHVTQQSTRVKKFTQAKSRGAHESMPHAHKCFVSTKKANKTSSKFTMASSNFRAKHSTFSSHACDQTSSMISF